MPSRSEGSIWGRWDLHFHTPSSYDYEDKSITEEEIVNVLKAAGMAAIAVTDHHFIDAKRIRKLKSIAGADITFFPGIELRTELGGKESVHLIGIFPDTADPEHLWNKLQGPLSITSPEVAKRGDDHVYVHFEKAALLIHELGGVVSVHVGRKSNSLENIGNDHPYKEAFKDDLAREHINLFELGQVRDQKSYIEKVFPNIGYERPLVICSDNHDVRNYKLKAQCWIKGDPAFETFQQVMSDPRERVFLGEIPPCVERLQKNPTKYLKAISFRKVTGSSLQEDWFSGRIPLNPGLIAIIGNKGMGKTALAEAIGLLGNTEQSGDFSFLNAQKFRQPRNNKAKHFLAEVEWSDGKKIDQSLDALVAADAIELVGYIPQNYIETICNEIQSADGRFDQELKSVIFSHVDEGRRLGRQTLDELLEYLTDQTSARIKQLRYELSKINEKIVEIQKQGSREAKQLLLNLYDKRKHELDVHEKTKPPVIVKPEGDPLKQKELNELAKQIEAKQQLRKEAATEFKNLESSNREALQKKATAERIIARVRNFQTQFASFIAESESDCRYLSLDPRALVTINVDLAEVERVREQSQKITGQIMDDRERNQREASKLKEDVAELTSRMDAPTVRYQKYLQDLQEWEQRREEIIGATSDAGSIRFFEKQLKDFDELPKQLNEAKQERESKTREVYEEIEHLVSTYQSLYSPVQKFIEEHDLKTKFNFRFEAAVTCHGFADMLFADINQARKGSFSGMDEGRKLLNNLIATADFTSANGALAFVEVLLDHLTHDRREVKATPVSVAEQLKKGRSEENLLDDIFSLAYLQPRYTIKWFGKNVEELSPGERGALLLVFYLLIDRRDIPLVIDQPEENLDNHTVYDLLVPCIKAARNRRQVIIVTHNPNLAVVCDADQVIHCSIDKAARNKVTYSAGSLENPKNNRLTVDVLEGTMPAFDHRDAKYQNPSNRRRRR